MSGICRVVSDPVQTISLIIMSSTVFCCDALLAFGVDTCETVHFSFIHTWI